MLGHTRPPFGEQAPLYVRERHLMLAALGQGGGVPGHVAGFIARLWGTHIALTHRLLLTGWAVSLLTPSSDFRRRAVNARRSPVNRSAFIKRFLVRKQAGSSLG
jgi:hypothetical protein